MLTERLRTPIRQVFLYGIRHAFIVIHRTMSHSLLTITMKICCIPNGNTYHTGVRNLSNIEYRSATLLNCHFFFAFQPFHDHISIEHDEQPSHTKYYINRFMGARDMAT